MLLNDRRMDEVFETINGATEWLSIQIAAVVLKADAQANDSLAHDVNNIAKVIFTQYRHHRLSWFALFFGNAQIGRLYDKHGMIVHYGTIDINRIYAELIEFMNRASYKAITLEMEQYKTKERELYDSLCEQGVNITEFCRAMTPEEQTEHRTKGIWFRSALRALELEGKNET
ncbi:MAG: hypothetical protein HUJ96_04595 [Marinilabiliaceae bacterium]|nr:hypothetical protein [Marinilabiliaceae bacterium]